MSAHRPLDRGWTVTAVSAEPPIDGVPATVPGCVHTDLFAAGLIDDPYLDDNEDRLTWIGRTEWRYETEFTAPADGHDRADLVFHGLDTVATVILNGAEIGTTANMHRTYRFPVRELLRPGRNTLAVHFASPYAYAERWRDALGDRPGPYPEPYPFIRKMACNFGWDWGPTLVTSGIWRPVTLHTWTTARLAQVRPEVTLDGRDGLVRVHVTVERAATGTPLTLTAQVAGASVAAWLGPDEHEAVLELRVPEPARWWPRGYGEQALHQLTVRLAETGETWRRKVGFRSIRLDTAPDPAGGSAFTLVVNDVPVFVRGANWIPDDCFPSRVTRDRLARRFRQACDANVNLLRVWGGGLYESDDFYDLADELGLLVFQDFPFACAAYPEEEPIGSEVAAEAREQVVRLAPHPSLALWIGNNENFMGYADWGWREPLAGRTWGSAYYLDLLPRVVAELDPTRPYWPGTPYSGDPARHPNAPEHGTVHIWDVWNELDYTHYATWRPRFVAEFGFQGPPAYATLRRSVTAGPLTADSAHQKAEDGQGKLLRGLGAHLPRPATFDDWHYYTQLNQARAVVFGVERFRALMPYCMGTIVWQLNDCWPVTSWAAVDGDGRPKPLWYALRRAYADRLLTVQDGHLVVINDGPEPWSGDLELVRCRLTGEPVAKESARVSVPPRAVARVPVTGLVASADPAAELLLATLEDARLVHFFAEDTAIAYPPAAFDAEARRVADGYRVTVSARTILRDLALFPDRLDSDATVDDMLVTLLPGEQAVFHVRSARDLDPAALTSAPVLRCVNDGK
ncbi:beta-mannosidase [Thermocatellispora tengchongensis]|uniref:beta-mannosidase n=1 Tax=Thermocatellispora tengchongensis TaxID=1073253 RepID=A0A840PP71_9ACTN|nr:glycoside hydrolase family 2 protein [Thermocatellispora tengchongensis]MBB5139581.1 beta-mannosidase [Thermocatellispora tengchongensis]